MEKFHYFLYGKEFTLESDQKPLVSIYKKHMVDISPRVQRLIVRSFPYLPFKVIYVVSPRFEEEPNGDTEHLMPPRGGEVALIQTNINLLN